MKTTLTLLATLIIVISSIAQNGINYKAIIKDGDGNVVTGSAIPVNIGILEYGNATFVYSETHSPTPDDNGVIILNIGEGTVVSGVFNDIDWGAKEHFLNLDVNIGSGWVDMGTTQFKVVPYAMHAETANNAGSSINQLSDGKSDNDGTNDGSSVYLGLNAGLIDDESDNKNVGIGYYALWVNTTGYSNTAIGSGALTRNNSGHLNTANGYQALTSNNTGSANTATGSQSLFLNTIGAWNTGTGIQTLQKNQNGSFNTASGTLALYNNISGSYNSGFGGQSLQENTTGNYNTSLGFDSGTDLNGSNNTFIGYKTGSGIAGTIRSISGSVFLGNYAGYNETNSNRLYIDNSTTASPLIYGEFNTNLLRVNGTLDINDAYQFPTADGANGQVLQSDGSGNVSWQTPSADVAPHNHLGENWTGIGGLGINITESTPLALASSGTDNYITYANANGYRGYSGIYTGNDDMDFGTGGGNTTGKVHLVTAASPKLTVDADGDVGIGTQNPTSDLHVVGTGRFTGTLNVGDIWVGSWGNFSSAYINGVSRISSSTNFVPAAEFSYSLGLSNRRWLSVWSHDGSINTSDRRDKTNIASLDYGLNEVMQLEPVKFNWKNKPSRDKKLGLIAQDLLKVIPEVVKTHEDIKDGETGKIQTVETERLGVYYSDLVPVLIKAIQEQQTTIKRLERGNRELNIRLDKLEKN